MQARRQESRQTDGEGRRPVKQAGRLVGQAACRQKGKQAGWQARRHTWQAGEQTFRKDVRQAGRLVGKAGEQAERRADKAAGKQAGRKAGRQAGRKTGRQAGRQAGSQEGRHCDGAEEQSFVLLCPSIEDSQKCTEQKIYKYTKLKASVTVYLPGPGVLDPEV